MRLLPFEVDIIKEIVASFDCQAKLILFGSRADDSKAGGDIDLLIISSTIHLPEKIRIRMMLKDKLGDQKIDLLVSKSTNSAFLKKAQATGVEL